MKPAITPIDAGSSVAGDGAAPVDAVARIEQSRRRLRRHLIVLNGPGNRADGKHRTDASPGSLRSMPLLSLVLDTVSSWWSQHPMRVVATLAAASVASTVRPVTQRHPNWTLFAALAAGGLVIWTRPWRFAALRRAVYAGLLPQFVSKVLSRMPTDGWMNLADSLLQRGQTASTPPGPVAQPAGRRSFPPGSDHARTSPLH